MSIRHSITQVHSSSVINREKYCLLTRMYLLTIFPAITLNKWYYVRRIFKQVEGFNPFLSGRTKAINNSVKAFRCSIERVGAELNLYDLWEAFGWKIASLTPHDCSRFFCIPPYMYHIIIEPILISWIFICRDAEILIAL